MAIPDGRPATDFNAANREWVRDVAKEAVDNAESELPEVSGSDNGDVLTVVSGVWAKASPPASGIPAPASPSDGDVLTYDSSSSTWVAEPSSGIPAPASPSDGDVLTYDSATSAWVAEAPSGGSIPCFSITIDELNNQMVLGATYAEIETLMTAGSFFIFKQASEGEIDYYYVSYIWEGSGEHDSPYNVVIGSNMEFHCTIKSEYPYMAM